MFTLVAYERYVDTNGALTYLTPIPDPHIRIEGNNIIVPANLNRLCGYYFLTPYITQGRIESPSLRRMALIDVANADVNTLPTNYDAYYHLFDSPLTLDASEPIRTLWSESQSGSVRCVSLLWLGDTNNTPIEGDIYTVRAVALYSGTSFTWVNAPLFFDQVIPAGVWGVVGLRVVHSYAIAGRLVFVGLAQRPGVIGATSLGSGDIPHFRRGRLGVWGEFEHTQPPTIDLLMGNNNGEAVVYLDLIKV